MESKHDERRRTFHKMNFKVCPSCWSGVIRTRHNIEGCRPSGDVYGYTKFYCSSCLWSTQFAFDDAADVYYYETKGWIVA